MIKSIYFKKGKHYLHEYYCDKCFKRIYFGEILRHEEAIKRHVFDLCGNCGKDGNEYEEFNKNEARKLKKNNEDNI